MKLVKVSKKANARLAASDSIYDGWGVNQGFVSTSDGAVVIDTGFTATSAKALLRDVRSSGSAPVRLVVNTHDHPDHVFGNPVFEENTPMILAHTNCRSRLIELGNERLRGYRNFDERLKSDLAGLRILPPQVTYADEAELNIGQTAFRFIHPKRTSHTTGDTIVLLPDERVLYAGDLVWVGYHANLEDSDVEGWLETLDEMSKMKVDYIVPGHGPVSDKGCIAPFAAYLRQLDTGMKKLAREGVPKEKVVEALDLPGTENWKAKVMLQRSVDGLYERYRAQS